MWMSQKPLTPYFYPRPPRGGRLLWMLNPLPACKRFLSTPSARRATDLYKERDLEKEFLSTPSARRATFLPDCRAKRKPRFLSTPSARRATHLGIIEVGFQRNFYPRPPRGGRPCALWRSPLFQQISIHALREEGDPVLCGAAPCSSRFLSTPSARRATGDKARYKLALSDFYPRPPRGGRPSFIEYKTVDDVFLSTPSARRATPLRVPWPA